ncbi:glucosaminidase domain-containing protein [Bacteroides cellulosilyticus]|uniref:N-acetylmuramoyl-L-alanine amidase n=3 Tax=Bacteroides TaxID=816 RepID=A0A5M6A3W1_9BACE|nr:glucosaminidase domain-containing protein [Bacteroides cellulosilyticus]KAA3927358.1 N-acetylmuramoyl-L-alanine amidase [Bacteroides ovatus]KAB4457130.1 N-acetylmuramoyl-L-alanine amidase [Bacteroides thetaiotaomicron]KAA3930423.1 N-acetylmuramoyl-L-alanine amidase [Bacteroides ovatus]KAA5404523.1 N-acetylmuramoyl-L-alanine amidase [Bacteroides cellulosilyticus]RYU14026.1 N-acetylmuramoyl-L-alanine amidase [Bacteroides cellulosilyticus]
MHNIILTAVLLILGSASASAQFYTITKEKEILPEKQQKVAPDTLQRGSVAYESCKKAEKDSFALELPVKPLSELYARKVYARVSHEKASDKGTEKTEVSERKELPALTIPNLYQEIIRNGIRHPKIVLAQAILETGWFRSPLCRNRHNLFGLTNPKTGKYYEFNHWTESVRAYYTKVQYKYTGGSYLLWLHKIGYAEDPRYVREVMKVVSQL